MTDSCIVMGVNDHRHCLQGWHDLQTDERNGVRFRWTTAAAAVRLAVPPGATALRILLCGPASLTGRPAPLSVYSAGRRLAHLPNAAPTDFWTIAEVPLSGTVPVLDLDFHSEELIPDGPPRPRTFTFDHYLKNGDHRSMGLMIAAIRVVK